MNNCDDCQGSIGLQRYQSLLGHFVANGCYCGPAGRAISEYFKTVSEADHALIELVNLQAQMLVEARRPRVLGRRAK